MVKFIPYGKPDMLRTSKVYTLQETLLLNSVQDTQIVLLQ